MPVLLPGAAGDPLPAGESILRLAIPSMHFEESGRASAAMFDLSTADRQSDPPLLSVWAEQLTTSAQAWELVGADPRYRLVLRLNVDDVRSLRPEPDSREVPSPDVVWDPLATTDENGDSVPDPRPGAAGHAGMTGLARGGAVTQAHTKSLRYQLARLARVSFLVAGAEEEAW